MSEMGYRTLHLMSSDKKCMDLLVDKCNELGLHHSGLVTCMPNRSLYLTVFPSDSKLGWPEDSEQKRKLYEVISVCNEHHYTQGHVSVNFTLLFSYYHDGLRSFQNIIELSI